MIENIKKKFSSAEPSGMEMPEEGIKLLFFYLLYWSNNVGARLGQ